MKEALEIAELLLVVVGAASTLAAALRPLVVKLRVLAEKTAWRGDDALLQATSLALDAVALGLSYVYKAAALVGLTPRERKIT